MRNILTSGAYDMRRRVLEMTRIDTQRKLKFASTFMLGAGLGKIAIHSGANAASPFEICAATANAMLTLDPSVHCWGCPVALLGAAMISALLIGQKLSHFTIDNPATSTS